MIIKKTSKREHLSPDSSNRVKCSLPSATINTLKSEVDVNEKNTSDNIETDPTSFFDRQM